MFLSGLGWPLPGLSEFSPEHRLLLKLAGPFQLSLLSHFFLYFRSLNSIFCSDFFSFFQLFLRLATNSFKFGLCELVFQVLNTSLKLFSFILILFSY